MDGYFWSLSLVYFFHLLATVVWIGGLAVSALLLLPIAKRSLDPGTYALFLDRFRQRFTPLSWLCLAILVGSGLFQMSASPQYEGFLVVRNPWSVAIFLKHLVFVGMTAVNAWLTWGVYPRLNRLAWLRAQRPSYPEAEYLERSERFWLGVNWVLSLIVLLLTAAARVAAG
ncbi:MAG: CopD family protein [Anaerolineales bacterium]|nr:CopD family protein [Anaerolineales bacterium]MDW8447618.1 CopD family protein [Anaerolineales bacterium]